MKYSLVFFLIIVSFSINVTAQEKKKQWDVDEISEISVFLFCQLNDSTVVTGTGTIIYHESRYFLITASHVAKNMDNKSNIVFHTENDKPLIKQLKNLSLDSKILWKTHNVADISLIELKLPEDSLLKNKYVSLAFPITQISSGKNLPSRDADITFFGYPILDLNLEHFSALSFKAYLSSGLISQLRADNKKKCTLFYLDAPSIQGCSGSGVFYGIEKPIYVGGKITYLIGIVHGTYSDNTGGKLTAVTPSYYIFDLFK
jgi:hypothetical protein